MKMGSKRDLIKRCEVVTEEIEGLKKANTWLRGENARLGTLLEGYSDLEIRCGTLNEREDELLIMLKDAERRVTDAERRVTDAENACKVKERVIVELKELRLDTSGWDRKIEELERRLLAAEVERVDLGNACREHRLAHEKVVADYQDVEREKLQLSRDLEGAQRTINDLLKAADNDKRKIDNTQLIRQELPAAFHPDLPTATRVQMLVNEWRKMVRDEEERQKDLCAAYELLDGWVHG